MRHHAEIIAIRGDPAEPKGGPPINLSDDARVSATDNVDSVIRHAVPSPTRGLVLGLDVLLVTLVVVAVALAPAEVVWPVVFVAAAFLGVYAWGRAVVQVHERSVDTRRGTWWPDASWTVGLVITWVVLLWLSPAALWIAFPLMLLQMHVLGPHLGVAAVAVTTTLAVSHGLLEQVGDGEPWTGYVLGPILGAGVAVGVVLGIEAFVRESQTRQRTVDELGQARRHLAQAEWERAVTSERARLARDIHDTVAQSLSAIELLLRTADDSIGGDDEQAHVLVGQARTAARDSLAEARRVVHDLTPSDLERTTLLAALRRVTERTSGTDEHAAARPRPSLTATMNTHGTPRPLPVPLEIALLRIAQSALANVAQHADATGAQMTLTYTTDTVTLTVVDDGKGIDTAEPAGNRPGGRGFGIPAIRSRTEELGGTFTLDATPGGGTTLTVTLPTPTGDAA